MAIRVQCGACKASFTARDEAAGRKGKCPKCGDAIEVPKASPQPRAPERASPHLARNASPPQQPLTTKSHPSVPTAPAPVTKAQERAALRERLMAAISGPIKPVRPSILYSLGLLWAAAVMVVLPLIYLLLIGLAIWAVQHHALHHVGMLSAVRGRGMIVMFALYAAPIVAGAIMVLFMIKPLFAPPADEGRTRFLTRPAEPLLFDFVYKLCEAVGSPRPTRIEVDCELNASAKFRRGWRSLFGRDLVLTIGAPLAAGLSVQQFSGVLAHEFGHFSQGMGMRLSFVVRSISHWFLRVVYQRDKWDAWLAESHEDTDWRFAIVMLLAQFCVWLSRRVLWVLMFLGHLVAGFLLRQMEFNADLHEARFSGSETFEATSLRMRALNAVYQIVMNDMLACLRSGKLPDNLSKLLIARTAQIPAEATMQIRRVMQEESTGLFDSHPCDKQRIDAAKRDDAPGVFQFDGPATALFADFDALSRSVTGDFYRGIFGTNFNPKAMCSTDAILAKQAS